MRGSSSRFARGGRRVSVKLTVFQSPQSSLNADDKSVGYQWALVVHCTADVRRVLGPVVLCLLSLPRLGDASPGEGGPADSERPPSSRSASAGASAFATASQISVQPLHDNADRGGDAAAFAIGFALRQGHYSVVTDVWRADFSTSRRDVGGHLGIERTFGDGVLRPMVHVTAGVVASYVDPQDSRYTNQVSLTGGGGLVLDVGRSCAVRVSAGIGRRFWVGISGDGGTDAPMPPADDESVRWLNLGVAYTFALHE